MNVWRVLVVEDDPAVLDFFAGSVRRCPQLELVNAVASYAQAQNCLRADPRIDVLLTDLGLPDGNGLDLIRLATRLNPACEPLVISTFGDEDHVLAAVEAGALGYIHKDATPADVAQTVLDMKSGGSPISPLIARRILARCSGPRQPAQAPVVEPGQGGVRPLTAREHDVLALISRGFSYAEIARLLSVSVHTVQAHIKSLYAKLSVHSKNEAVFEASRLGLL